MDLPIKVILNNLAQGIGIESAPTTPISDTKFLWVDELPFFICALHFQTIGSHSPTDTLGKVKTLTIVAGPF